MKKFALITIVLSLIGSAAFSQSDNNKASTGSVYSQLGIGYPVALGNTAAQSAGVFGVSYNETFVPSLANPARWGTTIYGMGTGGASITSYNASNATNSVKNANFAVNQFQLQLPLIRGTLGLSGSFSPMTESTFQTFEERTQIVGQGSDRDTLDIGISNEGSGGLNRAELGLGWQINSQISVGYAASLVFLSLDDAYSATFDQLTYRPANFTLETSGIGMGNRFGTLIQLSSVLQENDQLSIGAAVSLPVTIDANRKQTGTLGAGSVTLTNELTNGQGTIRMPMKVTGGLSYSPSTKVMVSAEGLYQGWSSYENDFKPAESQMFVDRYKGGLGLQYFPYVTGSDKFLSSFKYRVGASYDTGHLRIAGNRINTLKFSMGLGVRSPSSNSSIDLSVEYGFRGTESANLVKEQIWGVRLSVNLAELMFFRPKLQ